MAAAAVVANGDYAAVQTPSAGRCASGYSEVQNSRLDHSLPLPSVLKSSLKVVDGPPSSAAGNPGKHSCIYICGNLSAHALVWCLCKCGYECWIYLSSQDFLWSGCWNWLEWRFKYYTIMEWFVVSVCLSGIQWRDLKILVATIFCYIVDTGSVRSGSRDSLLEFQYVTTSTTNALANAPSDFQIYLKLFSGFCFILYFRRVFQ